MSDISSLYTQQSAGGSALSADQKNAGALSTGMPGTIGGFLDMLLSALLPTTVTPANGAEKTDLPLIGDPVTETLYTPLSEHLNADIYEPETEDIDPSAFLALQASATPMTEKSLSSDLMTGQIELTTGSLLKKESDPSAGKTSLPAMDTRLQAQMAAIAPIDKTTDMSVNPSDLNDIVVGSDEIGTKTPTFDLTSDLPDDTAPTNDLAGRLNAMAVGDPTAKGKDNRPTHATDLLKGLNLTAANDDAYMPVLTGGHGSATNRDLSSTTTLKPDLSKTIDDMSTMEGSDPLLSIDLSLIDPKNIVPTTTGAGISPIAAHGMKTALLATQGSTGHAAVQAVALHLQHLAQTRDTRSLTLQLNPPELGKMQIKMTYGRDKTVKADLLIEKSDTFHMMKNDADALKDVLNTAGLQTDAGSLNFTLADHGTFTNQDSSGDTAATGQNDTLSEDQDVIGAIEIKASEEWSVDPKTGIVRYNIVV